MNILAANDDGVECEGILSLAAALREAGHRVLIIAPDRERSGFSHSLSFTANIEVKELREDVWACRGTPADCVAAGICGQFSFIPDVTVAGINAGANLGSDLIYSGTAAAARQSALHGIPGIAFSLTGKAPFNFAEPARWAVKHFDRLAALWNKDIFINVNFPQADVLEDGWEFSSPTRRSYGRAMNIHDGEDGWKTLAFMDFTVRSENKDGEDSLAVAKGRVAVSRVFIQPASM